MRGVLKHIVARTYRPMLVKYLAKTRKYHYKGIELEIPPQVFHPGFFSSTKLLIKYIDQLPLKDRSFLELGAGSGLISIYVARKDAKVSASDINPIAIDYLRKNCVRNDTGIYTYHSNLFDQIPATKFDIIAINPPYYKKQPQSLIEHAWYCGENGEYYFKLFEQLPAFIHDSSTVVMVLCDGCDLAMIEEAANRSGFIMKLERSRQYLLEKNFIYSFMPVQK